MSEHTCPACGHSGEPQTVLTPEQVHHAKLLCSRCNRFIRWQSKPDADKYRRPASHRNLVKRFGRGYCEMCETPESELPPGLTLEGHHKTEFRDGGEPTRENVWILCTACHRIVNWARTYMGHWRRRGGQP